MVSVATMTLSRVRLDYGSLGSQAADPAQRLIRNISTVAQSGSHLWLASDEGSTIERLSWNGRAFADAASLDLADHFSLPDGRSEIDVEAISIDGRHLWIAGSHSLARQAPKPAAPGSRKDRDHRDRLAALATIKRRPRRYLIGKLTLSNAGATIFPPAKGAAPCVKFDRTGNSLTKSLRGDPLLAPFLDLPDKENGLDIEGLAAGRGRLFLGLRGPVIRGYSIILEIAPREKNGRLQLAKIGAEGRRYRRHFLDLGGLGVRDLTVDGDDLVMIAGPTMNLNGPWSVMRWRHAFAARREGIVEARAVAAVMPMEPEDDARPEGILRFRHPDGRRGWLVVYDNPSPGRIDRKGTYRADFFT
jgi:hypothetical protein